MKKSYLAVISVLLLLSGCAKPLKEDNLVITKITNNNDNTAIEVMDTDGNVGVYNSKENLENYSAGDNVSIEHIKDSIVSIEKVEKQVVEYGDLYKKLIKIDALKNASSMDKNELIEGYQLDETKVNDGVLFLSNNEQILIFSIFDSEDPMYFENFFNELEEGLEATYEKPVEELETSLKSIKTYEGKYAVMIIAEEDIYREISNVLKGEVNNVE